MNRSQEWIISTLLLVVLVFAGCSSYTPPDFVLVQGGPGGDFYISATEVTFDQYDAFCDATGYKKPRADFGRGNQPVINVNAADAIAYCEWLSKETGTTIRLPEENEWEFAAKGGMRSNGYQYSGSNNIDDVAWHDSNAGTDAHEVGTKQPNELGIYDMSGNVRELCGNSGAIRATRGGSWFDGSRNCQISSRDDGAASGHSPEMGFRVLQKK